MPEYSLEHIFYPIDSYSRVLRTVQECEAVCENTFTAVLARYGHHHEGRAMQLQLLRDCADICTLTAKYVARCSMFARTLAALCAEICDVCGNHCLRHRDNESQHCGRVCLNCAKECRSFAGIPYPYPEAGYPAPGYADPPGMYAQSEQTNQKK